MSFECVECEMVVYAGHAPSCSRRCQVFSPESGLQCDRGVRHPDDHHRWDEDGEEVVESWRVRVQVVASFTSKCGACDGPIDLGDRITREGTRWVHISCPPGRMDLVREQCSECFTEKSVTGACLCELVRE